jgi:hypothetical protein
MSWNYYFQSIILCRLNVGFVSMKKVAICISGYVRDFENCYKNLFDSIVNCNANYDFDIFIHTWNTVNSKNTQLYSRNGTDNRKFFNNFSNIDYEKLVSVYKPKSICVEEYNNMHFQRYSDYQFGNNPLGVFAQFYKVSQCSGLVNSYSMFGDRDYDIFIRTRFDAATNYISLDNFNLVNMDFYVENDGVSIPNWISDKFSIMNKIGFTAYANFYYNLNSLILKHKTTIPEYLLYSHLVSSNVRFSKSVEIGQIRLL